MYFYSNINKYAWNEHVFVWRWRTIQYVNIMKELYNYIPKKVNKIGSGKFENEIFLENMETEKFHGTSLKSKKLVKHRFILFHCFYCC